MSLLRRIGLNRPELRAWALYDWANSAFVTIIITAIFPSFFASVSNATEAAKEPSIATERLAYTTTIALSLVALAAPLLGALADRAPIKKQLLSLFMAIGVLSTGAMFFLQRDQWLFAALLFGIGNVGAMGSFVFYDALLPHIAERDEVDRVSTAGYALGYVGGGLLLLANIVLIEKSAALGIDKELAARLAFVSVALWWLGFSLPLFWRVREPAVTPPDQPGLWRQSFASIASTFSEFRRYRHALLFLLAFLIYNDGVGTIIKFAVIYGAEIGLDTPAMIKAVLLVQFVGIPCTFVFGELAERISPKRAIYFGLAVYCGVSVLAYFMTTSTHFFLLAIFVGVVQGGVQALSRSLFSTMIPRHKSSEFFGLFAVFEKFAGILGPLLFAGVISLTGSSRLAILAIIGFFVIGALLLSRVDIARGQEQAREQEAAGG